MTFYLTEEQFKSLSKEQITQQYEKYKSMIIQCLNTYDTGDFGWIEYRNNFYEWESAKGLAPELVMPDDIEEDAEDYYKLKDEACDALDSWVLGLKGEQQERWVSHFMTQFYDTCRYHIDEVADDAGDDKSDEACQKAMDERFS